MNSQVPYLMKSVQIHRAELMSMLYWAQIAESLAKNHSTGAPLSARVAQTVSRCADRIEHIAQYALDDDFDFRIRCLSSDVEIMRDILLVLAKDFHDSLGLPTVEDLNALSDALCQLNKSRTPVD